MYTFFWVTVLVISTIIHTITGTKYYTVSTFAGGGSSTTGEATSVSLTQPEGIVVDSTGANVYFADSWGYKVRKVVQSTNTLSVLNTGYLFVSVAVDSSGNVYSSCVAFYSLIFKYSTTGVTSVIAGHSSNSACTNTVGSDNGVPGTSVCLSNPYGIATDTTSSFLYIADGYHVIRKLDLSTNLIYVVAGTISTSGYSGDNGLATIACLNTPEGVAVDSSNSFYIADKSNNRIRKVTASTGIITTIAGSSTSTGFSGDGGAPTSALLNSPHHVSLNPYDNSIIYFSDAGNYRIRVIDITNNIITSIKDSGGTDYGSTYIGSYVAFDYTNNYLFSAQLSKVYKLTELIPTATPTKSPTVAPTTNVCTTGFYTEYFVCSGVSYCCDSRCWITNTNDCGNGNFCSCTTGYYTTYITPPTDPPTITPTSAPSNDPTAAPTAYVITRIAGSSTGSTVGYNGDGIDSTSAYLWYPYGVAVDSASNVYITDGYNNRVRKISATTSMITTYAGYGPSYMGSFCCDGNAATNAALYTPTSLAIDSSDNLYFSDRSNDRIRKVTASTQIISTIAGTGTGTYDYDSGVATSVSINNPWGVAADNSGNVYFADNGNSLVRKVDTSTGTLTTLVGSGTLSNIVGLAINSAGDTLYVSDLTDLVIYVIDIPANTLSSLSGLSSYYYGLAVDSSDDLIYTTFSIVYKRTMSTGISTVVAGGSNGYSGDGGPPTSAKLGYVLNGVAYDKSNGNYFIADRSYHMIRKVTAQGTYGPTLAPTATPTVIPTNTPTLIPTLTPTYVPTNFPQSPTGQPTRQPSAQPTRQPSAQPSSLPTNPTGQPTRQPSVQPSTQPSAQPSRQPTSSPSRQPTSQPTIRPSSQPSTHPSAQPSRQPTSQPSRQPTGYPTGQPTRQPTSQPTRQPTRYSYHFLLTIPPALTLATFLSADNQHRVLVDSLPRSHLRSQLYSHFPIQVRNLPCTLLHTLPILTANRFTLSLY